MAKITKKLTDLVGNIPLLELDSFRKRHLLEARLIRKLKYSDPLGSVIAKTRFHYEISKKQLFGSHIKIIFTTLFFCSLLITAKADEKGLLSDIDIIGKLTSDSTRIAKIENVVSKLPKMQLFINPRLTYNDNQATPVGFDIRRVQFTVNGKIMKNLEYNLMAEFAGSPKLLNVNAAWTPLKELQIRAGQFKIPFTLESAYSRSVFESYDNSQAVNQYTFYSKDPSGISSNGRDIGVSLYGGFIARKGYNIINYDIGIFNGNGINLKNNNRDINYVGRLNINPINPVTISGSFINGRFGDMKTEKVKKIERYAAGARYEDKRHLLRAEYITSQTEVNAPAGASYPTEMLKGHGAYVIGGYYFIPDVLQGLLKYDYIQTDKNKDSTKKTDYYAGANYFFQKGKSSHIQLFYCYSDIPGKANENQILAQLYIIF